MGINDHNAKVVLEFNENDELSQAKHLYIFQSNRSHALAVFISHHGPRLMYVPRVFLYCLPVICS